jgi:hypothetical protein
MNYQTRHLEALVEIPMGDVFYAPGARFWATPVDADYLVAKRKATELPATQAAALPSAPAPASAPTFTPAPAPVEAPQIADLHVHVSSVGNETLPKEEPEAPADRPAAAPATADEAAAPATETAVASTTRRTRSTHAAKSGS